MAAGPITGRISRGRRAGPLLAWGVALALAASLSIAAGHFAFSSALEQSVATGTGTLRLASAALEGHLARYAALPTLVAEQPAVQAVLAAPGDAPVQRAANAYLKSVSTLLAASDVYVMRPDGETVAASNFDGPVSFVGENFRYRPYFQAAAEGRQGRFFGLGTTSHKRGYYFSAPVRRGAAIVGIVVFKVDLDPLEASWASGEIEILVVDPEGAVFMAGRSDWRYRAFRPLGPEERSRTSAIRRYAERDLVDLGIILRGEEDGRPVARVGRDRWEGDFVVLSQPMPDAGWTVKVLVDIAPAEGQGLAVGIAVFLLIALSAVLAVVLRQRKHRLAERLRLQAEAREELERRVAERTAELGVANRQLEREVAERTATEETLRRTQSDLVETGKLAALGQMSAALSHEFNQPLAAASAYADNAVVLLGRDRVADALENVQRIARLMDRMSAISRHLRTFARRPDEKLHPVALAAVVADAMEIVARRIETADAEVAIRIDPEAGQVLAGTVRLQQVLVNLISNAADAVEGLDRRHILVSARRQEDGLVRLSVEDTGGGVPDAIAPRIFDPFFTTKGIGKGLGLGLSISYNIARDFGSSLVCGRGEAGGAAFALVLRPAPEEALRAAE